MKTVIVTGVLVLLAASAAPAGPPVPHTPIIKRVAATSPGKPTAPIDFTAAINAGSGERPAVARRATVDLQFTVPPDTKWLTVTLNTGESLSLVSGARLSTKVPADGRLEHQVVVVPQADGRFYLNITVAMLRNGEEKLRSFAVPIYVGSGATGPRHARKGRLEVDASGEALIIMQAQNPTR